MKRFLFSIIALVITTPIASGGDLGRQGYASPLMRGYNWTGVYLGGNLGGVRTRSTLSDSFSGASLTENDYGFIGGAQVGYNWQLAPQFVLGIEWMFDGTSIGKSSNIVSIFNGNVLQSSASKDWVSTLSARFGYAPGNLLFYGKAGGGWVQNSASVANLTTGLFVNNLDTSSGWLLGAGIEWGLTANWSTRLEYDYFGPSNWTRPVPLFLHDSVTLSGQIQMLTIGVNYKFW